MKSTMVAVLAILAGAGPSLAAPVRWQGEIMFTSKTGTCPFDATRDFARVRFRPGIGGDNGTQSRLAVFGPRNAHAFAVDGLFNSTFKTVESMFIGDGFGPYDDPVAVRFTSQTPATITTSTDFIDIKGEIRGWDFMPACTVRFKMTLFKRVE